MEYLAEEHREMQFATRGERYESLLAALRQAVYGVA
jgi:hypothetical protein